MTLTTLLVSLWNGDGMFKKTIQFIEKLFQRGLKESNIENYLKKYFIKYYKTIKNKWGGFEFSFYCCWDQENSVWDEKPDFKLTFDNYKRDTTKTANCYYTKDDPDRAAAIALANVILKAIEKICVSYPMSTIIIECKNARFEMSVNHERRAKVIA